MGRHGRRKGPGGRRTILMRADTHKELVERTRLGVPVDTACAAVGISSRTFYDWCQRGRREQDRIADATHPGKPAPDPDPEEAPYLTLWLEIDQARAQAAVRNVGHVQRAAAGGFVTEETTRKYRDENGELVEETTVKRAAPDWRAASWYLERQHPLHFGRGVEKMELTGADGGPVQVEHTVDPAALSAQITANIAAITAAPGEDVIEGETVED